MAADGLGMAHDDRELGQRAEPRIQQIRHAFRQRAAPETVGECLDAADQVTALLATLPTTEAQRYAAYLMDILRTLQDCQPPER